MDQEQYARRDGKQNNGGEKRKNLGISRAKAKLKIKIN